MKSIIEEQGVKANGFDHTLQEAELGWEVLEEAVVGGVTGAQMPNKKMLVRSDTGEALGVVGADYEPTHPREFLEHQYATAELLGGKVTRVGFIPCRSRVFAFIDVGQVDIPKGLRKKGDPLKAYIYATDGWDGGTPQRSRLFVERLICTNGMTSRSLTASLWVSHTAGRVARFGERAKVFQGEVKGQIDNVRRDFAKLASEKMTRGQMEDFLEKLMPGESTLTKNRREQLMGLFNGGVGNEGSTRWDAYNAVTEYVTHHRTYRKTDNTPVEINRFLGVLETDTLADRALAMLN